MDPDPYNTNTDPKFCLLPMLKFCGLLVGNIYVKKTMYIDYYLRVVLIDILLEQAAGVVC